MEVAPLPSIFLRLTSVLLCLWPRLAVLRVSIFDLSFFLWVGASDFLSFVVRGSQAQIVASFI
jgi:hypothetical protein